jgi:hypothetical protein
MCGKQVPGIIANSKRMSPLVFSSNGCRVVFFSENYDRIIHKDSRIINKIMEAITQSVFHVVSPEKDSNFKA